MVIVADCCLCWWLLVVIDCCGFLLFVRGPGCYFLWSVVSCSFLFFGVGWCWMLFMVGCLLVVVGCHWLSLVIVGCYFLVLAGVCWCWLLLVVVGYISCRYFLFVCWLLLVVAGY